MHEIEHKSETDDPPLPQKTQNGCQLNYQDEHVGRNKKLGEQKVGLR